MVRAATSRSSGCGLRAEAPGRSPIGTPAAAWTVPGRRVRSPAASLSSRDGEPVTDDRAALEAAIARSVGGMPDGVELFACDPALADTAAFCAHYGFAMEDSANTIVVVGKGAEPVYAACVVLATHRLHAILRTRCSA